VPPPSARLPPVEPSEIVALSDELGVSSARNLGAADMLKLRQMIDEASNTELLARVLRRLSVARLSPELSRSTGIDEAVAGLEPPQEDNGVRELCEQVAGAWRVQVAEELRRRELASRRGPKPRGTGAHSCKACQGAHRAHTCV